MKSYTSIEQSKKLAEILPIETADMYYCYGMNIHTKKWDYDIVPTIIDVSNQIDSDSDIPCWSLAALLSILPSSTLDSSDDHHYRVHCKEMFTDWYDNPIDCCIAMIDRLHEQMIYDFNNG